MSKETTRHVVFVVCFVQLHTYSIPKVANNAQKSLILFKVTVCFIWSLFLLGESQRVRKEFGKRDCLNITQHVPETTYCVLNNRWKSVRSNLCENWI